MLEAQGECAMKLLLAVDIADRLRDAASGRAISDIETEARTLMARHPEAHVSLQDVADTIRHEMQSDRRRVGSVFDPAPSL